MTVPDLGELSAYDYHLPPECIATQPTQQREAARLLVLDRAAQTIRHHVISDLPQLLRANDRLVLNDTKVLPARLLGTRAQTGGKWEGLYLETAEDGLWRLMAQTRGFVREGELVRLESIHHPDLPPLSLQLIGRVDEGLWSATPRSDEATEALLLKYGTLPLPPYMRRKVAEQSDWERYQTTYADRAGSVAAPTAGLHFTPELLQQLNNVGVSSSRVTLHVGIGTFKPIKAEKLAEHAMHSEWCEIASQTVFDLQATRASGGRIVAVGTTSVRTLESASSSGTLASWAGATRLFIRPPYKFRSVDCLLTNFHLPKSTLLVLVSTFAGYDLVRHAYHEAIASGYRFYSYGDAMLIL